jgi:hypothetical protein
MKKIKVKVPEDQEDTPGVLLSSYVDADGKALRAADGRVHLYER